LIVSLLLAIWSANGGVKAIIDALNVVYDEKEKRGFFKLNAISLAFTVGGVFGILTAIGLVIGAPDLATPNDLSRFAAHGRITAALASVGKFARDGCSERLRSPTDRSSQSGGIAAKQKCALKPDAVH
jgi:hypothetical protein